MSLYFDVTALAVTSTLGAFGGLLHALVFGRNRLRIPGRIGKSRSWDLSFLGDVLVGMGAAVAVLYYVSTPDPTKLVSLSVLAGFGGGSILGSFSTKGELSVEREKTQALAVILRKGS
jgi:hypothetical protein